MDVADKDLQARARTGGRMRALRLQLQMFPRKSPRGQRSLMYILTVLSGANAYRMLVCE